MLSAVNSTPLSCGLANDAKSVDVVGGGSGRGRTGRKQHVGSDCLKDHGVSNRMRVRGPAAGDRSSGEAGNAADTIEGLSDALQCKRLYSRKVSRFDASAGPLPRLWRARLCTARQPRRAADSCTRGSMPPARRGCRISARPPRMRAQQRQRAEACCRTT